MLRTLHPPYRLVAWDAVPELRKTGGRTCIVAKSGTRDGHAAARRNAPCPYDGIIVREAENPGDVPSIASRLLFKTSVVHVHVAAPSYAAVRIRHALTASGSPDSLKPALASAVCTKVLAIPAFERLEVLQGALDAQHHPVEIGDLRILVLLGVERVRPVVRANLPPERFRVSVGRTKLLELKSVGVDGQEYPVRRTALDTLRLKREDNICVFIL